MSFTALLYEQIPRYTLGNLSAFHATGELVIMNGICGSRLDPLVVGYEEVFGHGHEPDGSKEECEGDSFGHDTHDILGDQFLLFQTILTILNRSAYVPNHVGGLTLVGR
jgi:hypothetical protein